MPDDDSLPKPPAFPDDPRFAPFGGLALRAVVERPADSPDGCELCWSTEGLRAPVLLSEGWLATIAGRTVGLPAPRIDIADPEPILRELADRVRTADPTVSEAIAELLMRLSTEPVMRTVLERGFPPALWQWLCAAVVPPGEPTLASLIPDSLPELAALAGTLETIGAEGDIRDPLAAILVGLLATPVGNLSASEKQAILEAIRRLAEGRQIRILPIAYRFVGPPLVLEDLSADERLCASYVLRSREPKGQLAALDRFGQAMDGEICVPPIVKIVAGPPPVGWGMLSKLLISENGAFSQELIGSLNAWPQATMEGTLEAAALQTWTIFWADRAAAADSDCFADMEAVLTPIYRTALQMGSIAPANIRDVARSWVELQSTDGATTGRVRRLVRPGLTDREGRLLLPAIVEVE